VNNVPTWVWVLLGVVLVVVLIILVGGSVKVNI
jgi:hypothetical protein